MNTEDINTWICLAIGLACIAVGIFTGRDRKN